MISAPGSKPAFTVSMAARSVHGLPGAVDAQTALLPASFGKSRLLVTARLGWADAVRAGADAKQARASAEESATTRTDGAGDVPRTG
jgi:hypothetical protein